MVLSFNFGVYTGIISDMQLFFLPEIFFRNMEGWIYRTMASTNYLVHDDKHRWKQKSLCVLRICRSIKPLV